MKNKIKNVIIICLTLFWIVTIWYEEFTNYIYQNKDIVLLFVLLLSLSILLYILIRKINKPVKKNKDIPSSMYVNTGYEEELKNYLKSKTFDTLLINGKFGSGKTSLLNEVLKNESYNYLEFKMYEEYCEENYIEYLYKIVFDKLNFFNKMKCYLKDNKYIMLFIFTIFVSLLEVLSRQSTNPESVPMMLPIFIPIIYLLIDEMKTKKIDKLNIIKKELRKFDFLIIDDLDRVYVSATEVLKMIHYISESILDENTKLILLGDKTQFETNKLDYLEKYYDMVFEVPIKIVTQNLIKQLDVKLWDTQQVDYLHLISKVLKDLEPRKIIKIFNYIDYIQITSLEEYIKCLYLPDFLFVLILTFNNKVNMQKLNLVLSEMQSISTYNLKVDDVEKKLTYLTNANLDLRDSELEYIKRAYACYLELDDAALLGHIRINNKQTYVFQNRLFNYPHLYELNSYISDNEESIDSILRDFPQWVTDGSDKVNNKTLSIYLTKNAKQETIKLLMDSLEANSDTPETYFALIKNHLYLFPNFEKLYPNVGFIHINHGKDDDKYNLLLNHAALHWEKLHFKNKCMCLIHEANKPIPRNKKYFVQKFKNENKDIICEAIDHVIKLKVPHYVPNIIKADLKSDSDYVPYIKKIIELIEVQIDSYESSDHRFFYEEAISECEKSIGYLKRIYFTDEI